MGAARVVVYDPDGVNPYGRELAAQLAAAGHRVTAVIPGDAEWRPAGVDVRAVLPYNRMGAGSVARQAVRLLRGLLVMRRPATQYVVVWTRTRWEEALFALLARTRRVIVIVHNPGARDTGGRGLRARASTLVVHSPSLVTGVGGPVAVCAHPLYVNWLAWAAPGPRPERTDGRLRLLLLGHRRADKGFDLLPAVFAALPGDVRDRVEVVVCGKGAPPEGLGVRVEDRTSRDFVPDRDVAAALVSCDALLAPYTGATQSGTVALAVTAGLPVLGFASGAIAELAGDDGLVPEGDVAALAARIARAADGDLTPPPADPWAALRDWERLLS